MQPGAPVDPGEEPGCWTCLSEVAGRASILFYFFYIFFRLLDEPQSGHNSMRDLSDMQPCTMSLEGRLMFVAAFLCLIAGAGGKREEEAQPHKQPAKA